MTLGSKHLHKLRPVPFVAVLGRVLASTACPDVGLELARQDPTPRALKPLTDALDTFRTAQPAVRNSKLKLFLCFK